MESNKFELTGRVNFKDITYSQNGMAVLKLLLSKRKTIKDAVEYQSFNVTMFGETAEKIAEVIEKSDMVHIAGNLSTSKYEKDGKTVEKLQLIGNELKFIEFNEEKKKYVEIKKKQKNEDDVDEVPW